MKTHTTHNLFLYVQSSLRVLKAASCANLHEVIMQLPLNSPLQELWLNNCKALTKLHIVAPALTLLHVGGCKALRSVHLRTPKLSQLMANLLFRCVKVIEQVSHRLQSTTLCAHAHTQAVAADGKSAV